MTQVNCLSYRPAAETSFPPLGRYTVTILTSQCWTFCQVCVLMRKGRTKSNRVLNIAMPQASFCIRLKSFPRPWSLPKPSSRCVMSLPAHRVGSLRDNARVEFDRWLAVGHWTLQGYVYHILVLCLMRPLRNFTLSKPILGNQWQWFPPGSASKDFIAEMSLTGSRWHGEECRNAYL